MEQLLGSLRKLMREMGVEEYAVCGGHAIDLFLGNKTRPHKDLDVAVFWEDRDRIIRFMLHTGWWVFEPCGGRRLHRIRSVADQRRARDNLWCVAPENGHYKFRWCGKGRYTARQDGAEQGCLDFVEFLFNRREEGDFLYDKNPVVRMKLGRAIQRKDGIPYLAPELVLLYKSSSPDNPCYQLDFQNAAPQLGCEALEWLGRALHNMHYGAHAWEAEVKRLLGQSVAAKPPKR